MSDELFQLSNGRYITSEDISRKLYYIKDHHPETAYQDDSTGYSWDEAGMADLFSECYQNDTRYCPEAKSWYTYETGKWHKDVGALLVSAKIKEFVRLMALYCGEITDEEKRKQAEFVIVNDGKVPLIPQVLELISLLSEKIASLSGK